MSDLTKVFDDGKVVAKYTIQVTLNPRKNAFDPVRGSFRVWEKGGWFGMADTMRAFCPREGCLGTITVDFKLSDEEKTILGERGLLDPTTWPTDVATRYNNWWREKAICPVCFAGMIREDLPDAYMFRMPIGRVASRLVDLAHTLKLDTDIHLVRFPASHAMQAARAVWKDSGMNPGKYSDALRKARKREDAFYSMANIVADTSTGADLAKRFQAFLEA